MAERHLALFDFDGTITTRDTMLAFCRHAVGDVRYLLGLAWLSPTLIGYLLRWVPNDTAKVRMLRHFLGGLSRDELDALGRSFVPRAEGWVRPAASERLAWHVAEGHDVFIVSASLDLWLAPWAEARDLPLLCTRGAFDGGVFTGALATPNCHGQAKVDRVREAVDLPSYDVVHAYGDSSGDTEMLELAHEAHYQPFRS